jgi:hypothetical protein
MNIFNRNSLSKIIESQYSDPIIKEEKVKLETDETPQEQLENIIKMVNSKEKKNDGKKRKKVIRKFMDLLENQFSIDESIDSIFN